MNTHTNKHSLIEDLCCPLPDVPDLVTLSEGITLLVRMHYLVVPSSFGFCVSLPLPLIGKGTFTITIDYIHTIISTDYI